MIYFYSFKTSGQWGLKSLHWVPEKLNLHPSFIEYNVLTAVVQELAA